MSSSSSTILIVEDSFIVALHLKATLESEGYQVLGSCNSAEEALLIIPQKKPHLVLMDIMLNGIMDGVEAAAIINKKYKTPVIYISALSDKDTIQRAKLTQPYGFLTKPFEDREIFTVIEMALYKHSIESKLSQSEERYFSTVNSISDAVITVNTEYRISYMNPSAQAMTGWPLAEAMDRPLAEVMLLYNEETSEQGVNPAQCIIGIGATNRMPENLVLISKHRKEIPIGESSLSPMLDEDGNSIGLIIVFKDMFDKRQHERLQKEVELKRTAALIEGQEKERARIAKDLHDGLGQMLNAIKMNAELVVINTDHANNLSKLMDEAIQESVRISENLMPAKLRDFDLSTCIRSLCDQISDSTHFTISYASHRAPKAIGQLHKVNFFRIAQEALTNAIKHSDAKKITVQLNDENNMLRLSIEDDGMGIPYSKISKRQNGLINMKERAEIMGGKLILETDPQRGTHVLVEVPTQNLTI